LHRDDVEPDRGHPVVALVGDLGRDALVLRPRALDRFLELDVEIEPGELEQVQGGVPRRGVEERPGVTTELHDLERLVDDDARRPVQLQHLARSTSACRLTSGLGAADGGGGASPWGEIPKLESIPICGATSFFV
jgi:hypothetical protein